MPRVRQQLRQRLYRLAASQAGYFTARQALDIGFTYQAQRYHVGFENWERIDRGIFRIPEWPIGQHDSFIRWVLWSKGRGVVSHDSAADLYNIGNANPAKVHLTVDRTFRMSNPMVVLHRSELPPSDATLLDGVAITTPLRTVLDISQSHYDEEFILDMLTDAIDHAGVRARHIENRLHELSATAQRTLRRGLDALATKS